jgi:hypothetical protein
VNNALFTSLAMEVSTVTRSVASAGYNFLHVTRGLGLSGSAHSAPLTSSAGS